MQRFFWILALLLAVSPFASAETIRIRAMTYNVHHGDTAAATIGAIIHNNGAKIVGLNECNSSYVNALLADLNGRRPSGATYTWTRQLAPGTNDIDAIITAYPILSSSSIVLTSTGDRYGATRTGLRVTVDIRDSANVSHPLHFFVTHLSLGGDGMLRNTQCQELRNWINTFTGGPKILSGDYNIDPDAGWADHVRDFDVLQEACPTDSYREIKPSITSYPGKTIPTPNPTKRYDHLLYTRSNGLQCVAADVLVSAGTASDHYPVYADYDWTITSTPPVNQAPTVSAGPDRTITLPGSATLSGTVSDDGLPNPPGAVSKQWSKVSGPGTVTFASAASAATTATFSTAGVYTLRLTANDGALSRTDDMVVTVNAAPAGLPSPWQHTDVGNTAIAGSASYSSGTFTLKASGVDLYNTTDGFHYVYQSLTTDGTIVARVTFIQNTSEWAQAGVMIRTGTGGSDRHASMLVTPSGRAKFRHRSTAAGATSSAGPGPGGVTIPQWVKVVRAGNSYSGYYSANGTDWTLASSATIDMGSTLKIGLFATSYTNAMGEATFTNVSVTNSTPNGNPTFSSPASAAPANATVNQNVSFSCLAADPDGDALTYSWSFGDSTSGSGPSVSHAYAATGNYTATVTVTDGQGGSAVSSVAVTVTIATNWTSKDVGQCNIAGSTSISGGTFIINASGKDLYGGTDGFRYVYKDLNGDGTIIARVTFIQNTSEWAQAGVMIRKASGGSDVHAAMLVTPSGRAKFRRRHTAGGATSSQGPGAGGVAIPQWVKLVRAGNTFSGYRSDNGTTWTLIGTDTVDFGGAAATIGLFATSYTQVLGSATIEQVSVTGSTATGSRSLNAAAAPETSDDVIDLGVFCISDREKVNVALPGADDLKNVKGVRWTAERGTAPSGVRITKGKLGGAMKKPGSYTFKVKVGPKGSETTQTYKVTVEP